MPPKHLAAEHGCLDPDRRRRLPGGGRPVALVLALLALLAAAAPVWSRTPAEAARLFNNRLIKAMGAVQTAAELFAQACVAAIAEGNSSAVRVRARLADLRRAIADARLLTASIRVPDSPNAHLMQRSLKAILEEAHQTTETSFTEAARILADPYYTAPERAGKLQALLRRLPPLSKEVPRFFAAQKRLAGEFGFTLK